MSDDLLDPNCLQTLIPGPKSRESERDYTVFAHESFVLAWFLRISKHNVWVSQSASDEDPKPKLIVRIGFCTAKLKLCVLSIACTHF